MKISSFFFHTNEWSTYATLQTLVLMIIMRIGISKINLQFLALASIISMIKSDLLLPKLIYALFLCLLTWNGSLFFRNTFFTLLGTLIIHFIPYNNVVHKLFMKNKFLYFLLWSSILIWFLYFFYILYKYFKV